MLLRCEVMALASASIKKCWALAKAKLVLLWCCDVLDLRKGRPPLACCTTRRSKVGQLAAICCLVIGILMLGWPHITEGACYALANPISLFLREKIKAAGVTPAAAHLPAGHTSLMHLLMLIQQACRDNCTC